LDTYEIERVYRKFCFNLGVMKERRQLLPSKQRKLHENGQFMALWSSRKDPWWESYFFFVLNIEDDEFFKLVTRFAKERGYERYTKNGQIKDGWNEDEWKDWIDESKGEKNMHFEATDEKKAAQQIEPRYPSIPFLEVKIQDSDYHPKCIGFSRMHFLLTRLGRPLRT
jgi:hypothetical protein